MPVLISNQTSNAIANDRQEHVSESERQTNHVAPNEPVVTRD